MDMQRRHQPIIAVPRYHRGLFAKLTTALAAFGPLGVLVLAFIDSVGIPVGAGMDLLIILVGVKTPDQAYLTAFLALAGSLGGNLTLYYGARHGGNYFARRRVQPVDPAKPGRFRAWFERFGLVTVFIPAVVPFFPLPLKPFVASAGVLRTPVSRFVATVIFARVLRYFGEAFLAVKLGSGAEAFLRHNTWNMVGIFLLFAALVFVAIRLSDRGRATEELS
jgi:membrane protein YqaA with SNARE-associated domain